MARSESAKQGLPRVWIDADILFAGAASPGEHGASLMVLRMAEITLIEALASRQVVTEARRNLETKLPQALPAFELIVSRCLKLVSDPLPADLVPYHDLAHPKDVPILAAAVREQCRWLVTFNVRDYQPGHANIEVVRPGEFILRVRELLAHLEIMGQIGS
jgi:predicted nucleic acid-binding protein